MKGLALGALLGLAASAFAAADAAIVDEIGDAPSLAPGQVLPVGTTGIRGLSDGSDDVDLYAFDWTGGVLVIDAFESDFDTQLHLFAGAGGGLADAEWSRPYRTALAPLGRQLIPTGFTAVTGRITKHRVRSTRR